MNDFSKRFIERQDWFCYYGINKIDISIGILEHCTGTKALKYGEILKLMSKENIENLRQYSIKNLMHIVRAYGIEEDKNKIVQLISEKMDNNEVFYTEENMAEVFLKQISISNSEFFNIGKELQEKVKANILERREALRGTSCDEIVRHFTMFTDMSNFLAYYEQGTFTEEKIETLKKAIQENPKALVHTNFSIFKDEIYGTFGEDFILYALKFPNLSMQLDILSKANPNLLQIIANQVNSKNDLRDNVDLVNQLVKYCTINCYEINLDEITEKTTANLIDSALRNNKSKRDIKIISVPYSENYESDLEELFKEEYERATDYIDVEDSHKQLLPKKETKLDIMKNLYLNKYFSMSLKETKTIIEMYGQDIDKIDSAKGQELISGLKK